MKAVIQGLHKTKIQIRNQRQSAAVVLGLLASLSLLGYLFFSPYGDFTNNSPLQVELPPYWTWLEADTTNHPRAENGSPPVYAYSVIPGGVRSGKELKEALSRDAVAATHYAGFDVRAAKAMRLNRSRQAYVSYRLGNHIYWTRNKVTLHAGETILTDGRHLVRGRCGNRISEVRTGPTTDGEPPEPALNAPVLPPAMAETSDLPPPPPIWTEAPTPLLLAMNPATGPTSSGGIFVPPFPIVPCCGGSSGLHTPTPNPPPSPQPPTPVIPQPPSGPTPNPPPVPPPPVVPTPEPPILELLLIGLVGAMLLVKLRRS